MAMMVSPFTRPISSQLRRYAAVLLCLAWIFVVSSQAQTGGGESDQGPYALNGTVINSVTGEPVSGAYVTLSSERSGSTSTDVEGHFQFRGLPSSTATLSARKPGFFSEYDAPEVYWRGKFLDVGPDMPPVVLKLIPKAEIVGQVYDV